MAPEQPTLTPIRLSQNLSPTDECATRLHDLGEPLIMYYVLNKRMPPTLEDIKQLAGPDPRFSITCPVSGKPYGYAPQGLKVPGQPLWVILYDAEPSHDGQRRVFVVKESAASQPLITNVHTISDAHFKQLIHPSASPPPSTPD